jgi:hypothetical protein
MNMLPEIYSRTSTMLLLSILAYGGLLIPLPFAPVAMVLSMVLLIFAKQEYSKAYLYGYPDDISFKLGITMALALGNILATAMIMIMMVIACIIFFCGIIDESRYPLHRSHERNVTNLK